MRLAAFISPGGDFAAAVECVRRAESAGYESVWVTHGLGRDSFLVLAAYKASSPYSFIGAERELLQMMAYEPMILLTAIGMYMVTKSFAVDDIAPAYSKAAGQLGSVGGGNHFVEMQVDRDTGEVFVMVHCGSRGYGWQTA